MLEFRDQKSDARKYWKLIRGDKGSVCPDYKIRYPLTFNSLLF